MKRVPLLAYIIVLPFLKNKIKIRFKSVCAVTAEKIIHMFLAKMTRYPGFLHTGLGVTDQRFQ